MAQEYKAPEFGEGVHEGELVAWKVKVGDAVKDDQVLVEVMTDKATIELPAPFAGSVTEILAKEGEMVKVGQVLLRYDSGSSARPQPAQSAVLTPPATSIKPTLSPTVTQASSRPEVMTTSSLPDNDPWSRTKASPAVRRDAREAGVALSQIPATGPEGRVLREDLQRFLAGGSGAISQSGSMSVNQAAARGDERIAIRGLRKKIAEKMRLSKDRAAHFTYVEEADATALVKLRERAKKYAEPQGIKVTYLPFVMKAMAAALRKYPTLNSNVDDEANELIVRGSVNIAISVQTDDGLTAPVIQDVQSKSILRISQEIQEVVARARSKKLTKDDLTGGTITLTNVGSIGGLFATPIINYPEVAILGLNKIFKAPVVKMVNGRDRVVVRYKTYFSISLDHRVIDGAIAAEFVKSVIEFIEEPNLLLLESI